MNQETLTKYQQEQKVWAERNFPNPSYSLSALEGLIEETGEIAHARLKARQGIRGTPEQHLADEQDAVADAMVFLLDLANRHGWRIEVGEISLVINGRAHWRGDLEFNSDTFFLELCYRVGLLASSVNPEYELSGFGPETYACQIAHALILYSQLRGWNFLEIFERTWSEVSARDWIRYPETGKPPTGESS